MKNHRRIGAILLSMLSSVFAISCQTNDPEEIELPNNIQNFEVYHYRYIQMYLITLQGAGLSTISTIK